MSPPVTTTTSARKDCSASIDATLSGNELAGTLTMVKSGAKEQAKDLLSQLQDLMNNLQAGRQQPIRANRHGCIRRGNGQDRNGDAGSPAEFLRFTTG